METSILHHKKERKGEGEREREREKRGEGVGNKRLKRLAIAWSI